MTGDTGVFDKWHTSRGTSIVVLESWEIQIKGLLVPESEARKVSEVFRSFQRRTFERLTGIPFPNSKPFHRTTPNNQVVTRKFQFWMIILAFFVLKQPNFAIYSLGFGVFTFFSFFMYFGLFCSFQVATPACRLLGRR